MGARMGKGRSGLSFHGSKKLYCSSMGFLLMRLDHVMEFVELETCMRSNSNGHMCHNETNKYGGIE